MGVALAMALAAATMPVAIEYPPPSDPCQKFDRSEGPIAPRPVDYLDLAEIADIGRSDPNESPSPFGISPDGKQIAFVVRRANPAANAHCERLLVVPFDQAGPARELDRGGEFIRESFKLRNFTAVGAGYVRVITPKWSPDGKTIAYLKRVGGATQVWLVDATGSASARKATAMPDDVEDFFWSDDGSALIVATRPGRREEAAEIGKEARIGYLFDDRFFPAMADHPLLTRDHPLNYARWSLREGTVREASAEEIAGLSPVRPQNIPKDVRQFAAGAGGVLAWTERRNPDHLVSPTRLVISDRRGRRATCEETWCESVRHLWWSPDGRALVAVLSDGWGKGESSILTWQVGEARPRRTLVTEDMLIGCAKSAREVVCAREGSTRPRRLVAIDPATGRERVVYDPNPRFANLHLGKAQRFRFRNSYGVDGYADLILPPDHRPGQRHPLVVVQYTGYGFLRGGTADEFPIQVLAGRGFAVLSFNRPDFVPAALEARSETDSLRENYANWTDRRNVHASLEVAVRRAIDTGTVDPERMGISGFSNGISTVQWALINSTLFKVAAMGSCCEGENAYPLGSGPHFERALRGAGYRFFEEGADAFWQPMSLVLNADRITTPILIQTSDSEYEGGLDTAAAFRIRQKPFELYVFDDEGHFISQPAHRLAMYERSVEWFEFWLMGRMNCDPVRAAQNERWRGMKGAPAEPSCAATLSPAP